ncbi:hypothetical protein HK102_005011 [Quaeritorhiza haematococci]|nr:hypothetical protein HK102_005011 [Quaeritorhiza haematococci]
MTLYLTLAWDRTANAPNATTAYLGTEFTRVLALERGGKDITADINRFFNGKDMNRIFTAMDKLFLAGRLQGSFVMEDGCDRLNGVLFSTSGFVFLVLFFKCIATILHMKALSGANDKDSNKPDPHTILFVPVYNEPVPLLRKTLRAAAMSEFETNKKLLFIVVDGIVCSAGSYQTALSNVLEIAGYSGGEVNAVHGYVSVGHGTKYYNNAKVYSGYFQDTKVPFVLVGKVGNPFESNSSNTPSLADRDNGRHLQVAPAGNRGKRDSMLILMNFLNRLGGATATGGKGIPLTLLCPLEVALYRKMMDGLGVDPRLFQYFTVIDADTIVEPDGVRLLVQRMEKLPRVAAMHGTITISNPVQSVATVLQVFPYYHRHELGLAFDSILGNVSSGWMGGFACYRIHTKSGQPCLVHDAVINAFSGADRDDTKDTMHMYHAMQLGEDRYLASAILRADASRANLLDFSTAARASTTLPSSFGGFICQWRREFNTKFHLLWDIATSRRGDGGIGFFSRLIALLKMKWNMLTPAATAYFYFIAVRVLCRIMMDPVWQNALMQLSWPGVFLHPEFIVAISFVFLVSLHTILLMVRMTPGMIPFLYIFATVGLPLYAIVFTLYCFATMDDLRWSNAFTSNENAINRKTLRLHGADMEDAVRSFRVLQQKAGGGGGGLNVVTGGPSVIKRKDSNTPLIPVALPELEVTGFDGMAAVEGVSQQQQQVQTFMMDVNPSSSSASSSAFQGSNGLPRYELGSAHSESDTLYQSSSNSADTNNIEQLKTADTIKETPFSGSSQDSPGSQQLKVYPAVVKLLPEDEDEQQNGSRPPFLHPINTDPFLDRPLMYLATNGSTRTVRNDDPPSTTTTTSSSQSSSTTAAEVSPQSAVTAVFTPVTPATPRAPRSTGTRSGRSTPRGTRMRNIRTRQFSDSDSVSSGAASSEAWRTRKSKYTSQASNASSAWPQTALPRFVSGVPSAFSPATPRAETPFVDDEEAGLDSVSVFSGRTGKPGSPMVNRFFARQSTTSSRPSSYASASSESSDMSEWTENFAGSGRGSAAHSRLAEPISLTDEERDAVMREDLKDEIHFILEEADLNKVTRREVKEQLIAEFGEEIVMGKYAQFIDDCVEEFTLEKLALL